MMLQCFYFLTLFRYITSFIRKQWLSFRNYRLSGIAKNGKHQFFCEADTS
jgi:hypothetical protein